MTRLNLRQRLLLLSLLPSALIAITLVSYFTFQGIRTLEGELRSKALSSVRYLAQISEYGIIAGQTDTLYSLAQAIVQESGVKAAVIVNQKGRVIAVSGRVSLSSDTLRQPLQHPGLVDEREHWIGFGAPVYRSLNDTDPLFDVALSGNTPNEAIGQVFIELDKEELIRRQQALLLRGLMIVIVGLLLIAAITIALADNLARPIHRLVAAVDKMARSDLSARVPEESQAEIGRLEQGFNTMAAHIEEAHLSLQTRIEEATAQLAFQARHDALTGLLNRREFEARLERCLVSVQAGSDPCSLLFIDLDRFKPVNDTCGHLAGDELLRQIAQLFNGRLRDDDILGRLGGDEFGVILSNCSGQRARQVADDLCGLAGAYRFIWQDKVFSIGASIGLTTISSQTRKIADLLAAADAACYDAKEMGRNQVCEREAYQPAERRKPGSDWTTRISLALAEQRLHIEAAPMLALNPETAYPAHCVELTGRLQESGQPPIALSALKESAEREGLSQHINQFLLDTALQALLRCRHAEPPLHCLVPVSASLLKEPHVLKQLDEFLRAHDMAGDGLCLMFDEDVLVNQSALFLDFVRQVRMLGCHVGLENFGGSLASITQLRALTPTWVKLSHSLTRDITANPTSMALLRAIQEIATDHKILTIASHIDDRQALPQLTALGTHYAEGRAIGPEEPFDAWVEGVVMRHSGAQSND